MRHKSFRVSVSEYTPVALDPGARVFCSGRPFSENTGKRSCKVGEATTAMIRTSDRLPGLIHPDQVPEPALKMAARFQGEPVIESNLYEYRGSH
jgi:hypothetical protein